MTRNLFGGIPDKAINHGFSQRRPIRSMQIPTEVGKSPTDFTDIHRFFIRSFLSRRFFLFIGWHGIYSEVFLMRRLHTDFRGGDLSGRCRYPLELEYVPQRKICVYLWNLWDEIIPTKKNLRHLRNLRDKNNRSIYRARAIGQRPKFRENPWVIR